MKIFLCYLQRKFSVKPSVFVTSKHYNPGLKRDAASVWIEDVTKSSCKVCMRELQNYAGSHQDIFVVSIMYPQVNVKHGSCIGLPRTTPLKRTARSYHRSSNSANSS